jgi:biofilm PGA synthesis N-glycosyltransferase PgaC
MLTEIALNIWITAFFAFIILYFGYFLLIFVLSKWRSKQVKKSEDFLPHISVLIPCYNVETSVDQKLENLWLSIYPREKLQVIAVESGSVDQTFKKLSQYGASEEIELIKQPKRLGKSSAINAGLERCVNDIVVITDAEAKLDKYALRELVKNLADPDVGAVVGSLVISPGKSIFGRMNYLFFRMFRQKIRVWESKIDSVSFLSGELCAFRKSIVGKISERAINDDRFILLKTRSMGLRCVCEPLAHVSESTPSSLSDHLAQKRRTTMGAIQGTMRFKHLLFNPKYGLFGKLILPAYLIRLILFPFLLLLLESLFPLVMLLLLFSNAAIWMAVGLVTVGMFSLFPLGRKTLLPFLYGIIVQIAILMGMSDYLLGKQSVLWLKIDKS